MGICTSPRQCQEVVNFILNNYTHQCIQAILVPQSYTALTGSKFGGVPYWDLKRPYPCNALNEPLCLVAQINCADLPEHDFLPYKGLLQFYCENAQNPTISKVVYFPRFDLKITSVDVQKYIANTTRRYFKSGKDIIWGSSGLAFKSKLSLPLHLGGDICDNMLQDAAQNCLNRHLNDTALYMLKQEIMPYMPEDVLVEATENLPATARGRIQLLGFPYHGDNFEPLDTTLMLQVVNFNLQAANGKNVCGLDIGQQAELYFTINNGALDDGDYNCSYLTHVTEQNTVVNSSLPSFAAF